MESKELDEMIEKLVDEAELSFTAMSKWEVDFIRDMADKKWHSEREIEIIEKIYEKMFG